MAAVREALGLNPMVERLASLRLADEASIPEVIDDVSGSAESTVFSDVDETARCDEYLAWVSSKRDLKVVKAAVPEGILPDGCDGSLYDVRVFPSGKGPRTDDAVYTKHPEIRERVARGNCLVELRGLGGEGARCARFVVRALGKFTGGLGDEDEMAPEDKTAKAPRKSASKATSDDEWRDFFTKPFETATHVISMDKANGEAAHLAAAWIQDRFVLFPGSKNVHIAITCREDIAKYEGQRFLVARNTAEAVMTVLESLSDDKRRRLVGFLASSGLTAVFELLQPSYQHVELLEGDPKLMFLAWSRPWQERGDSLCSIQPAVGLQLAASLGLSPVRFALLPIDRLQQRILEVRRAYGREGDVMYFIDKQEQVIGLLKMKACWYVLLRAAREKLKAAVAKMKKEIEKTGASSEEFVAALCRSVNKKVRTRFGQIAEWLSIADSTVEEWTALVQEFIRWVLPAYAEGTVAPEEVRALFPVVWRRFLEESGRSDRILAELRQDATPVSPDASVGGDGEDGPARA